METFPGCFFSNGMLFHKKKSKKIWCAPLSGNSKCLYQCCHLPKLNWDSKVRQQESSIDCDIHFSKNLRPGKNSYSTGTKEASHFWKQFTRLYTKNAPTRHSYLYLQQYFLIFWVLLSPIRFFFFQICLKVMKNFIINRIPKLMTISWLYVGENTFCSFWKFPFVEKPI